MSVIAHGFDEVSDRALFSLSVASTEEVPSQLSLGSPHFVCFLAWDARQASVEVVSTLVARLLQAGASYFVCWGPDCERVHDVIDEIAAHSGSAFNVPHESCIMTTWHDSESLEEALWFFLVSAWPDDYFFDSTRAALAISLGSSKWALSISSALQSVREFIQSGSDVDVA